MTEGIIDEHGELRQTQIYLTAAKQALMGTGLLLDRLVTLDYRSGVVRIEK